MSNKKNNSNKNKKNVKIFAGIAALALGGALTLTCCSGCQGDIEPTVSYSNSDLGNKPSQTTSKTTSSTTTTAPKENVEPEIENESMEETEEIEIELEDVEPVYQSMSAEEMVTLSNSFSSYINKAATLSHNNYKFAEITPEDLYSVVYLANIDIISKEETARLIEAGIISDNIQTNVVNSFNFYELYSDDTINKIMEGKTDLIDLSLILANKHDQAVAQTMNKIMIDSIKADNSVAYKNYMDTVFYYAEDVTLYNTEYDYSQSIYETDRDKLSVGGDYTLGYVAVCIDEISKMKGVANVYASEVLTNGANDFSNVVGVFNGCKISTEINNNDKTLTK